MAKHPAINENRSAPQAPSSQETASPSFHPHHITRATFDRLLTCYPGTVEAITRRKATERASRASSAAAKKAKTSKRGPPLATRAQEQEQQSDHGAEQVDREVRDFLRLDERRYSGLPALVRERAEGGGGGGFLTREELVEVMEWKLKHGVSRPMLLGMVKGNQEKAVQKATADAFAAVPGRKLQDQVEGHDDENGDDEFPKPSLDMLTGPLRGVGPATASLLLSVGTGARDEALAVPFYSDDTFLWLCLEQVPRSNEVEGEESAEQKKRRAGIFKPSGEINVKYNVQEYRQIWDAERKLRKRLNKAEASSGSVSCADVEKVALVLRHIDASGFFGTESREGSSWDRKRKRN